MQIFKHAGQISLTTGNTGRTHYERLVNKYDLEELSNLGEPPELKPTVEKTVKPGCEVHASVLGNAVNGERGWGQFQK